MSKSLLKPIYDYLDILRDNKITSDKELETALLEIIENIPYYKVSDIMFSFQEIGLIIKQKFQPKYNIRSQWLTVLEEPSYLISNNTQKVFCIKEEAVEKMQKAAKEYFHNRTTDLSKGLKLVKNDRIDKATYLLKLILMLESINKVLFIHDEAQFEETENIEEYFDAPKNENKNKYKNLLRHFRGISENGGKLLSNEQFESMINDLMHLINEKNLPLNIKSLPKLDVSSKLIMHSYYKVFKEIYPNKGMSELWTEYLYKKFGVFDNWDKAVFRKKCSSPPEGYNNMVEKLVKKIV